MRGINTSKWEGSGGAKGERSVVKGNRKGGKNGGERQMMGNLLGRKRKEKEKEKGKKPGGKSPKSLLLLPSFPPHPFSI